LWIAHSRDSPYKPNLLLNLLAGLGAGLLQDSAPRLRSSSSTTHTNPRGRPDEASIGVPRHRAQDGSQATFVEDLRDPGSIVSEAYSAIVAALRFSTETRHAEGLS
jgi:hypothetical protein